jgi:osmotically-inducible protein OsmY
MKYLTRFFFALFLALTLITVTGCAETEEKKGETAGEFIDDSTITTKVKSLLIADPVVDAHEINVDTHMGVVQLSGFVDTRAESEKAAALARGVEGVRSVKNDIRLK